METPVLVDTNQQIQEQTGRERSLSGDPIREPGQATVKERDPERGPNGDNPPNSVQSPTRPLSRTTNLLTTAALATICGVAGAMGYSYLFGSNRGDLSSSRSSTEADSIPTTKRGSEALSVVAKETVTHAPKTPSISELSSSEEFDDLKEQMKNLAHRIDGLGERVDRLQQLLSLTVPLLQRIAPKN